nr:MAG: hypothetical protein J07AB56_09370 [Candidatus Nanosalinarum sp. J07AB56]
MLDSILQEPDWKRTIYSKRTRQNYSQKI